VKQEDHLSPWVWDQPGQQSKISSQKQKKNKNLPWNIRMVRELRLIWGTREFMSPISSPVPLGHVFNLCDIARRTSCIIWLVFLSFSSLPSMCGWI
jgi:hypothetical protein